MRSANIRYVDYGGGGAHDGTGMGVASCLVGEKIRPNIDGVRTSIAYSMLISIPRSISERSESQNKPHHELGR